MVLSIVATSPRIEARVLASGMLRLLLLLVFLRTIAHCGRDKSTFNFVFTDMRNSQQMLFNFHVFINIVSGIFRNKYQEYFEISIN